MTARDPNPVRLLGDLPTEFVGTTARHRKALATAFGTLAPTRLRPRARIEFAPGALDLPTRDPDEDVGGQLGWRDGDTYTVECWGLTARVAGGDATIRGDGPDLARRLAWIGQPVLADLLSPFERPLLHAAAIERDGIALLVMGASGRGKSTTTFAAHRSGWRILGDDHVVLRRSEDGAETPVEICGIPKPVAVPGELADGIPAGARRMTRDARERWQLPATVLGAGWHPLAGTLWLDHAKSALGYTEPANALELLRELVASHPAAGSHEALTRLMPLASTVARGPAWRLRLGADPATRVADAGRLLDTIASASDTRVA
ncbi:MAG: hypothetical protein R3C39_07970 [Dehalococcoidia bacterium]